MWGRILRDPVTTLTQIWWTAPNIEERKVRVEVRFLEKHRESAVDVGEYKQCDPGETARKHQ